jgi:hypothetical protein
LKGGRHYGTLAKEWPTSGQPQNTPHKAKNKCLHQRLNCNKTIHKGCTHSTNNTMPHLRIYARYAWWGEEEAE